MKNSLIGIIVFFAITNLFALYNENFERPVLEARGMAIERSEGKFENISHVNLILTKRDGEEDFTGMLLHLFDNYKKDMPYRIVKLEIVKVDRLDCGSKKYYANILKEYEDDYDFSLTYPRRNFVKHRFTVELTDHTSRTCRDLAYADYYYAEVREGYGWADALDNKMQIYGNPGTLYSVY